jgi:signal recognition particle subunit SRP54
MTGQDAVNSAKAFNEALELNGVIMTKLDGDARGGALLSVRHVTGVPIKFIGTGEHLDALEIFYPEGMAERILGLGDIRALVTEAQRLVDEEERVEFERKLQEGEFSLEDFKNQMQKLAQPGLVQRLVGFLPGLDQMREALGAEDTAKGVRRLVGIVNSMTPAERRNPKLIDPSRRQRIARGAGVEGHEVTQLVKQFELMRPVMEGMAGKGVGARMKALQDLQKSGMLDPGARFGRIKKGTGKRLSNREKAQRKQQKEKELRRRRREQRREPGSA